MKRMCFIGIVLIVIILLFVLIFIKINPSLLTPAKMNSGIELDFKKTGNPKLNEIFTITYSVKNTSRDVYNKELTNLKLDLNLPDGVELISGNLNMQIDSLKAGDSKEFTPLKLKVIKNGAYNIESNLKYNKYSNANNLSDTNTTNEFNTEMPYFEHKVFIETLDDFYFIDDKPPKNEWVINSAKGLALTRSNDGGIKFQDFNFYFVELPAYNKEVILVFEIIPEKDYSFSNVNLNLGQRGIDVIKILSVTKPTQPNEFVVGDLSVDKDKRNYSWNGDFIKDEPFKIEFLVKSKYCGSGNLYLTVNNKIMKAHVSVSRFKTDVNYSWVEFE